MEENDKIRKLFDDFKPDLSSGLLFMEELKKNMKELEIVKEKNNEFRKESRRAAVLAACVGFIVGFLASLFIPYAGEIVTNLSLPFLVKDMEVTIHFHILAWMIVAGVSIITALNTYDLTVAKKEIKNSGRLF